MENELAMAYGSPNPVTNELAAQGRKGDAMMAHVTPGDYVIPKDILVQHPDFLVKLKKVMSDENEDYRTHMVGSGFENINPETGAAEFGFGRRIKKFSGAFGQAVHGLTGSNTLGRAAAVGSGFALGGLFGTTLAAPSGAMGGSSQYSKIEDQQRDLQNQSDLYNQGYRSGTNVEDMKLPGSLQELGGLTDEQKRSYLATQGSQGEGLGGASRDYYANLLQRNIQQNKGALLPVESQYLGSQGMDTGLTGQALINALRGF